MFTGIVEEIGIVRGSLPGHLAFEAHKTLEGTRVGDSIAVNGVCLTVVSLEDRRFGVDVMPETLRRTNLGRLRHGDRVNLERGLALGGRIGGHLVLGHVDDTGEVLDVSSEETSRLMRVSAPAQLMPYMVRKGFIAVDGVSLTIVELDGLTFVVSLVAHTMRNSTLGEKNPGDIVNLEADVIGKYVESLKERKREGLTIEFLREHGFVGGIDAG